MNRWRTRVKLGLGLMGLGLALVGHATPPAPVSPAPVSPTLMVLTYHNVVPDADKGQDPDAITPNTFLTQMEWLKGNGWTFVSWADVQAARAHQRALPPKAVMLTFDDGLTSVYTQVYPLLQAYHAPAAIALVRAWMDLPDGDTLPYNGQTCTRACFITWAQARAMEKSGLVTVFSHSADLHHGVVANAAGNTEPSAITWQIVQGKRETAAEHRARVKADLIASQARFEITLGHRVSAIAWPYGAYNDEDVTLAREQSMTSFGLSATGPVALDAPVLERWLVSHDVHLDDWVGKLTPQPPAPQRAIVVSFQALPDDTALGNLIERAHALQVGEVWLTDPWSVPGDAQDRWNRVVWQLRTRGGAQGVIVWPANRPLDPSALTALAQQATLAAVVIPGTATAAEQRAAWTTLQAWRPAVELRVLDPQHGLTPGALAVQTTPPTDPLAYYWVPTQSTPTAGTQALLQAVTHGHNRLVYATDWLASTDTWRTYKPGVSLSSFPYPRP